MTFRDETAGTGDPKSLLEQLRDSIVNDEGGDSSTDAGSDQRVADALTRAELATSGSIHAAADAVIPLAVPTAEARARMIDAAERALARRRDANGQLPVVLRVAREHAHLTVEQVAKTAQIPVEVVKALESGVAPVDRESAETVGGWIFAVPTAEPGIAYAALEKSLRIRWTPDTSLLVAGGTERPGDPANISTFVNEVRQVVNSRADGSHQS